METIVIYPCVWATHVWLTQLIVYDKTKQGKFRQPLTVKGERLTEIKGNVSIYSSSMRAADTQWKEGDHCIICKQSETTLRP